MAQIEGILKTLESQAQEPPGGDVFIAACYRAVIDMIGDDRNGGDSGVLRLISEVSAQRAMTDQLFVNLFLRAFQYSKLYGADRNGYPHGYEDPSMWKKELPNHLELMKLVMLEKETVTTKFERYAGPFALLKIRKGRGIVRVADLGCGANYGLNGWMIGEQFGPIDDDTPGDNLSRWLANPDVSLGDGLAVDKNDPRDPEVIVWRMACTLYPGELHKIDEVKSLEARLEAAKGVEFVKADITQDHLAEKIDGDMWDGAIISTVLYQMTEEERCATIKNAKEFVRGAKGIVIVQDFFNTHDGKMQFDGVSWGKPYNYRTAVIGEITNGDIWEVLEWNNGRCTKVRPGKDWEKFCDIVNSK